MTRAAGVAFYAMLALVPFLALILTLAVYALPDVTGQQGREVDNQTVRELKATLQESLPKEASGLILKQIKHIQQNPPTGLLSFGVIISLWLASTLFTAVIDAMNAVYGVEETRPFWKMRLTAIVMTIIQAVILVGSLVVIAAWPIVLNWLGLSDVAAGFATVIKWLVVLIMVMASFALTFYVAPDADQRWEWITPGSLLGTPIFLIVSYLFGIYVRNFGNYNETYGSLAGVMVLLFWFWIVSLIVLSAGQLNKVIEDASPLGRKTGKTQTALETPKFEELKPEEVPAEEELRR